MKKLVTIAAAIAVLASLSVFAAPGVSAATTGYWIDRAGDELNEPYEEAKDDMFEPIPGSITSSGAFGIAGATFSKPIGKTAFKVSFDLDWVSPKRFSDAADSTKIINYFIYVNFTYTGPNEMEPWGGFSAPGPWETWSDGNFVIYANKVGVWPVGSEQLSSGGSPITTAITNIAEGVMDLPHQGTITVTLELKNNIVTLNLKAEDGTDLGTASETYVTGFFNSSKSRYFAITHFNGAFVFDITNFKIISSDIPDSVGATATSRPAVTSSQASSAPASSAAASSAPASSAAASSAAGESGVASTDGSAVSEESIVSEESGISENGSSEEASETASSETEEDTGKPNNTLAIILIVAAVVILAGAGTFYFIRKRKA